MRAAWLIVFLLAPAFAGCTGPAAPVTTTEPAFEEGPVVAQRDGLRLRIAQHDLGEDRFAWDAQVELDEPAGLVAFAHGQCASPLSAKIDLADGQWVDLLEDCGRRLYTSSDWEPYDEPEWRRRIVWDGTLRGATVTPGVHEVRFGIDVLYRLPGETDEHVDRKYADRRIKFETSRDPGLPLVGLRYEPEEGDPARGTFVAQNVGSGWAYLTGGGCVYPVAPSIFGPNGRVQDRPSLQVCTDDIREYRLGPGESYRQTFAWDRTEHVGEGHAATKQPVAPGSYEIRGTARYHPWNATAPPAETTFAIHVGP